MIITVITFLALLSLSAAAGTFLMWGSLIVQRVGVAQEVLANWRLSMRPLVLWLSFTVASVATAGSLFLSEIAHFTPCTLCWYQRIAMYPLVLLLGIAAFRNDLSIRLYAMPIAAIGAIISAYHIVLQRLPGLPSGSCSISVPCDLIYVERFGFITIPVMAFIGFVTIMTLLWAYGRNESEGETDS